MEHVHQLTHQLRPSLLDDLGLAAALRSHARRQAQRAGFEVELDVDGLEGTALPPATVTTCFRIVQESLTNVVRHAGAGRVAVKIGVAAGALNVMVHDNGRGFDLGAARERARLGTSLGLLGMAERTAQVGGELTIESTVGRGTTVHARLPWDGPGVT